MRGMPPLQSNNRFACLEVDQSIYNETSDEVESAMPEERKVDTETERKVRKRKKKKWERKLPKKMVLAAIPSSRSLKLQV